MESPEERPEEREGFAHSNLLGYVRKRRPKLLVAALTILRAYFAAGKPDQGLSPWDSFEDWSTLVRNALVLAGQPDPEVTRRELAAVSDCDAELLGQLVECFGSFTASE